MGHCVPQEEVTECNWKKTGVSVEGCSEPEPEVIGDQAVNQIQIALTDNADVPRQRRASLVSLCAGYTPDQQRIRGSLQL